MLNPVHKDHSHPPSVAFLNHGVLYKALTYLLSPPVPPLHRMPSNISTDGRRPPAPPASLRSAIAKRPMHVMPCQRGAPRKASSDERLVGRRVSLKLAEDDVECSECVIKQVAAGRCLVVEPGGRQVWFPAPTCRRALLPEVDGLCSALESIGAASGSQPRTMDGVSSAMPGPPPAPIPSVTATSSDPTVAELLAPPTTLELALATGSYPPPRSC